MRAAKQLAWTLILTTGLLVVSGCARRDLDRVGKADTPLVLLLSPQHAATAEGRARLADLLSKQSGLKVELRAAENAAAALNLVDTGRADAALLPVFEYLFCREAYGAKAGLQVVRHGTEHGYAGEILVREDGDVKALGGLAGKPFAFVDPYSTSGFVLPAAKLREAGVAVEPVFAGSHEKALALLEAGEVVGAATYEGARLPDGKVRVLAETGEIPNEPVFFRKGLEAAKREKLSAALVAVAGSEAGAPLLVEMGDVTGFAPIDDRAYDAVAAVVQKAGKQVQDLVPSGWTIYNESRTSPADYAQ